MKSVVRIIQYSDTSEYIGRKISEFLSEKGYSVSDLTRLRHQENCIFVGEQSVHMNRIIQSTDIIKVAIFEEDSNEIKPVDIPFNIVYEDEDILVVDKPAGLPVHPSKLHPDYSLANAVIHYYKSCGRPFVFRCVNRLDKDTSGLTIIAKHMLSASVLYEAVKRRELDREYRAIVYDNGILDQGFIELPIGRLDGGIKRTIDLVNGEYAKTNYQVMKRFCHEDKKLAYVSYHLETGRTHQIRVHMESINCPLIGDSLYNQADSTMDRQALHAISIKLAHPLTGESLFFEAKLPEDMEHILGHL